MLSRLACSSFLALAIGHAGGMDHAFAQDVASPAAEPTTGSEAVRQMHARQIYTPADFARYAPRNALDLIEQIPGFQIDQGDGGGDRDGGRGFGQASGNLLINGERISSKSTSTADQLKRIPVEDVVRIELVDGAMLEIPGLSGRVANIVVRQSGSSRQFRWRPEWNTGTAPAQWFEGELSMTGQLGGVDYTFALENRDFARGRVGPALVTLPNGTLDERRNTSSNLYNRPNLNAYLSFDLAAGVSVNLNATGGFEIFDFEEEESRVAGNPFPALGESFLTDSDAWFYELGGDITFPLGHGNLKLIALETFTHRDRLSNSLVETAGQATGGSQFIRLSDEGERIGRGEYSWGMWGADWQLSAEAAFNRLDQVGRLFDFDPQLQDYVEVNFASGVGGVREDRYEVLLSAGFAITPELSLQLIGGGELSRIAQTGSNALSRSFRRPKGTFSLAWAPVEGLDINFAVERRVGQLEFADFLASVNLSDEQANAGNNSLRPQQSWESELEIAKNFGALGSATLRLFDERIKDLVLFVPVSGGLEARGNIDSAWRRGLRVVGTLQLAPLGLAGAQIDLDVQWEDSRLLDPVTGAERRFDRNDPYQLNLGFRHDIPRSDIAWGWSFSDTRRAATYRLTQVFFEYGPSTNGALFIEHKNVFGATANLQLGNLLGDTDTFLRTVYAGPRDVAPVSFTENRRRDLGQKITLTLTGNF